MLRRIQKKLRRMFRQPASQTFEIDAMIEVFTDANIRVTALGDPDAPNLFLCFTGVQQGMGGIGAEEFVGTTRFPGFSALFISDLQRSWYNNFPPSLLTDAIGARVAGKRLIGLGNSMGGYGAVWIAQHLPVATVIAFAPQFSVHPEVVPAETRWQEFRSQITHWRERSLSFNDTTRYFTINGDADEMHWSHFPRQSNCTHLLIKGTGHNPGAKLKERGILRDTISACVAGNDPHDIIAAAGLKVSRL